MNAKIAPVNNDSMARHARSTAMTLACTAALAVGGAAQAQQDQQAGAQPRGQATAVDLSKWDQSTLYREGWRRFERDPSGSH